MPKLFGLDIAKLVATSIAGAGGVLDATLIITANGTRNPSDLTAGTNVTETSYPCKGFVDEYGTKNAKGDLVHQVEWKVSLLGATLPEGIVPVPSARVTIDGGDLTIIGPVSADPAEALYTFKARLV